MMRKAIAKRLLDCGLELHPEKTRIIYCKDDLRKGRHTDEKFDFLGYEFRPRKSINRNGKVFANFSPAVSTKAASHPKLASAAMQPPVFGRPVPPLQSDYPGLVPILRQVLPYRALLGDPTTGSGTDQLGQTEIQEAA